VGPSLLMGRPVTIRLGSRYGRDLNLEQVASNGSYRLRDDVVATVLDHGALLLDLDSKYFYLLNPSGWAVAQLFEDGASVDHAVERASAWGASEGEISGIRSTIEQMVSERLLEPAASAANVYGDAPTNWEPVRFERQAEPLQKVIVSAFDPSIPLAE
jgi:hypothetical protein